jgi:peptidoglycan/xylan/chitin deacetylase (PgdA/CDA1 family)
MKRFLFALLHWSCVLGVVSWLNRKRVTILCYHSVLATNEPAPHDPNKQHIPLGLFLDHLDYLQSNYRIISLTEFVNAKRENRRLPNYSVVLTFDDGFEDFFSVATPHLARRKVPATVFVITGRAYGYLPPNGECFLSWQEIQELAASGVQMGSHTCSHPALLELPFDEARRELADSLTAILQHLSEEDVPLSFPYGQTSETVSKLAQSLGYSCGITGTLGPNRSDADLFALSRTVIASDDDVVTFAARVSGLTWWASKLRRLFETRNGKEWEPHFSPCYGSVAAATCDVPDSSS